VSTTLVLQREEWAISAAVERIGFRVSVSVKRHLEEAARLLGVPLTEFVLGAARDRADAATAQAKRTSVT
jgi:uncharacterized protein (DUF1778 family)